MRCKRSLKAATAFVNLQVLYEIIPIFGSFRARFRARVAAAGATLDFIFVGPDFDPDQELAAKTFAQLAGTQYTSANPTQLVLVAGTEGNKDVDLYGEGYVILKLTGSGSGTIDYVDIAQLPNCG